MIGEGLVLLFEGAHHADHGNSQAGGEHRVEIFAWWRKLGGVVQQRRGNELGRGVGDVLAELQGDAYGVA